MAGGFAALLDDIAALAKLAAASVDDVGAAAGRASVKAAGVVVDDAAVTPRFVEGVTAERELPIVKRIAVGSLRNKLLIILPVALLLSSFAPWALAPILMLGGSYLAFEGAEKVYEALTGHGETEVHGEHAKDEATIVNGAIRTDLILSAEIMVISLASVSDQPILSQAAILVVVALLMTAVVYGAVALIVKMDDLGLRLARRDSAGAKRIGLALVRSMPGVLKVISVIGIAAMLWVGGHILLTSSDEIGWHTPYAWVHHLEEMVHDAVHGWLGSTLAWLVNTGISALVGLIVGAILVGLMAVLPVARKGGHAASH